jgi:ParB family chromosome partitioning protein
MIERNKRGPINGPVSNLTDNQITNLLRDRRLTPKQRERLHDEDMRRRQLPFDFGRGMSERAESASLVEYKTGVVIDKDAAAIGDLYVKARASMIASVQSYAEIGRRLDAKKAELKAKGEPWLPWLKENEPVLGFGERTARRLMSTAEDRTLTSDLTEEEAAELLRKMWGNKLPANYSSKTVEWYTPPEYVEAAREALGGIDLDPASSEQANATVRAAEIFTAEDDGLVREWRGRVFLNPPYGTTDEKQSRAGLWCVKAIEEYVAGRVSACIILVNSSHSQAWQKPLYRFPICLVHHRIKFVSADGATNENPTFGDVFVYLGRNVANFVEAFNGAVGYVMLPAANDNEGQK